MLFDGILPAEEKDTSNLSKADLLSLPSGGARQFNSRLGVSAPTSSIQVWSLTQFSSVDFASKDQRKKNLYFVNGGTESNKKLDLGPLKGVSLPKPFKGLLFQDRNRGVSGRNGREQSL